MGKGVNLISLMLLNAPKIVHADWLPEKAQIVGPHLSTITPYRLIFIKFTSMF